jgi:hypothetical protein
MVVLRAWKREFSLFSYFILYMGAFPSTHMSSAFKAGFAAFSGEPVDNDEDEQTAHQEAYERENRASSWWFPLLTNQSSVI